MKKRNLGMGLPMFSSIRLRNFKAYKDSKAIPLRPLTVLVGKNNSGKSTILHSLLLLKQTLDDPSRDSPLVTSGPLVELGGWKDMVHGAEAATAKTIGIELTLDEPTHRSLSDSESGQPDYEPYANRLDLGFSFSNRANAIQLSRSGLWLNNRKIVEVKGGALSSDEFPEMASAKKIRPFMFGFIPSVILMVEPDEVGSAFSARENFGSSIVTDQSWHWRTFFRRLQRITPVRSRVPWYSGVGTREYSGYGESGENLLATLGRPSAPGKSLLDAINEWVSKHFKILEKLIVKKIDPSGLVRSLVGREGKGGFDINIAAMGEGVSQLLPIVAIAVAAGEDECLLIEQPEIHLHPALQADLADLFIEMTIEGKRQVLVETHSEHLVLRLRRRVAEGVIDPSKVAIIFVDREGSESRATRLEMNGKGDFDHWPEGFFDEGYQEAMALAMAASKKG